MRLLVILAATTLLGCTQSGPAGQESEPANESSPIAESEMPPKDDGNAASVPIRTEPGASAGNEQANRLRPLPEDDSDECGASKYQKLVGQPRSRIPEKPPGADWRVTCSGCPITMDYRPERLNIFYDEKTEIVEDVRCG